MVSENIETTIKLYIYKWANVIIDILGCMQRILFRIRVCMQSNNRMGDIITYLYGQLSRSRISKFYKELYQVSFILPISSALDELRSYSHCFVCYEKMASLVYPFISKVDSVDQSLRFYEDLLQI